MDEKEIKKLKEDIEKRELELKEKQTKLEEEYTTKKADLETLETTLKESLEKFEADKVDLEQAKAKLAEYDTLKADFETMKKDFEDTKKIATTAQNVAQVANDEAKSLRTEKKEIEANIKADELIVAGKVRPADKEVLMQALTAEEGATIELKEKDADTTRKLTKSEVLLELIASGPAKVDLSQRGVVLEQKGDSNVKELIEFANMSKDQIAKLDPGKREDLMERMNKYSM